MVLVQPTLPPPPTWLAKLGAMRVFPETWMEEREGSGGVGWVEGGDWGNYTQADSICFSSVLKHPPPLEHSYFQVAAFPYRRTDARGWLGVKSLTCPTDSSLQKLTYSCFMYHYEFSVLQHVSGLLLKQLWATTCATVSELCCSLLFLSPF